MFRHKALKIIDSKPSRGNNLKLQQHKVEMVVQIRRWSSVTLHLRM